VRSVRWVVAGEMRGRCGGDAREMWERCAGEMWGRCGGDAWNLTRVHTPAAAAATAASNTPGDKQRHLAGDDQRHPGREDQLRAGSVRRVDVWSRARP
jgi:hypothetical protein